MSYNFLRARRTSGLVMNTTFASPQDFRSAGVFAFYIVAYWLETNTMSGFPAVACNRCNVTVTPLKHPVTRYIWITLVTML